MQPVFQCLSVSNILLLFFAILLERKVLLFSYNNALLTTAAQTLTGLMYPFKWEYVYIPLLPHILSECVQAPTPFIMGINQQYRDHISDLEEVCQPSLYLVDTE
jgi:hypothetical protein